MEEKLQKKTSMMATCLCFAKCDKLVFETQTTSYLVIIIYKRCLKINTKYWETTTNISKEKLYKRHYKQKLSLFQQGSGQQNILSLYNTWWNSMWQALWFMSLYCTFTIFSPVFRIPFHIFFIVEHFYLYQNALTCLAAFLLCV